MSKSPGPFVLLGLVAVAAAVGAVTSALLAPDSRVVAQGASASGDRTDGELAERLDALERCLERLERSPRSARGTRGAPTDTERGAEVRTSDAPGGAAAGEDADAADGETFQRTPEQMEAIRAEQERLMAQSREAERRSRRQAAVEGVRRRIRELAPRLGLDPAVATAFAEAAAEGALRLLDAQEEGLGGTETAAIRRDNQRRYQELLGEASYRELRKIELDRAARPTIVSIAGQAGVDSEQREQIETLLTGHIESLVDLDVRIRTQELDHDEQQSIRERMNDANRRAWDRIRDEILTEEQRNRVPRRLR